MALPIPVEKEEQAEFVFRCMKDDEMKSKYADDDKRFAAAMNLWNKAFGDDEEDDDEEDGDDAMPEDEEKKEPKAKAEDKAEDKADGDTDDEDDDSEADPEAKNDDDGYDDEEEKKKVLTRTVTETKTVTEQYGEALSKAGESDFENAYEFAKVDNSEKDYTYVEGPVLVPESIDKQGDVISASEIEKTAHDYMEDSQRPGLMHQLMLGNRDARIVQNYVARAAFKMGSRQIKKGTWMVGMRVYEEKMRRLIADKKLRGFSIGGHAGTIE